mmetsp:Transcript_44045/g.80489  ORF Transcript_44045/g.80489 Transcript_44045/m.80489 type:complete len:481 (-) Transcript_44045:57-1499(-)
MELRHVWQHLFVVLVLGSINTSVAGAADDRRKKQPPKVQLKHHSFVTPLNHADFLEDWRLSGASIAARDRLLLHPAVPQRAAFVWSKKPLLTNNFEATFQFRVMGPTGKELSADQGFAFWYVSENHAETFNETVPIAATSWGDGLEELGLTLLGARPKFDGFGTILTMSNADKGADPMVSGIFNADAQTLKFRENVPTQNAKAIDFRNTLNPAQVKVVATPTSITGSLKQSPSLSWKECFRIEGVQIRPGGYIGFTAWSGSGPNSDLVSVLALEVTNLDEDAIGEEMSDSAAEIAKKYEKMVHENTRHIVDQKGQTAHLAELTSMLQQHIEEVIPQDQTISEMISGVMSRTEKLEADCKQLVTELGLLVGDGMGTEQGAVAGIKEHIVGLRQLFSNDSRTHHDHVAKLAGTLATVKQAAGDGTKALAVKIIAEQSSSLEITVQKRNRNMTGMLLTLVGCIVLIGLLMWNRMRYYEKKHFI